MEANNMNPDQTAPKGLPREQTDLGTYCLQYRLIQPKTISRREEHTTKIVIDG